MRKHYIMVVDGEVAGQFPIPDIDNPISKKLKAILESDPKIVVSNQPVPEGWNWDGEKFYNPDGD